MKTLQPYIGIVKVLLVVAGVLAIFYAGMRFEAAGQLEKEKAAADQALAGERALQDEINAGTSAYINRMKQQMEDARALPKIQLVHDCPVSAAVGGVLNAAQQLHADAGTVAGTGAAGATVDSTCSAELDIAKRNYAEVCIPNAEQLTELQRQWELVRGRINQK